MSILSLDKKKLKAHYLSDVNLMKNRNMTIFLIIIESIKMSNQGEALHLRKIEIFSNETRQNETKKQC